MDNVQRNFTMGPEVTGKDSVRGLERKAGREGWKYKGKAGGMKGMLER